MIVTEETQYPVEFEDRLLAALLTFQADLAPTTEGGPSRTRTWRRRSRGRVRAGFLAATAAAAVLVALAVVVPGDNTANRPAGKAPTAVPTRTPTGWQLAGYITPPGWRVDTTTTSRFGHSLVCATTTFCLWDGVGGAKGPNGVIMVTHDGGSTWHQAYMAAQGMMLGRASCPSPTTCMVVAAPTGLAISPPSSTAEMLVTTDAGVTWTSVAMPGGPRSPVIELSCVSPEDCAVLGVTTVQEHPSPFADVTSDGGATWSPVVLPAGFVPGVLSCLPSSRCVASERGLLRCAPSGSCVATGSTTGAVGSGAAAIYSTDAGVTWRSSIVPPTSLPMGAASCADPLHCIAMTLTPREPHSIHGVLTTSDGGARWVRGAGIGLTTASAPGGLTVTAMSCATATTCWAGGTSVVLATTPHAAHVLTGSGYVRTVLGIMMMTTDGGQHWRTVSLPSTPTRPVSFVDTLSCPSSARCYAGAVVGAEEVLMSNGPYST